MRVAASIDYVCHEGRDRGHGHQQGVGEVREVLQDVAVPVLPRGTRTLLAPRSLRQLTSCVSGHVQEFGRRVPIRPRHQRPEGRGRLESNFVARRFCRRGKTGEEDHALRKFSQGLCLHFAAPLPIFTTQQLEGPWVAQSNTSTLATAAGL